YEVDATNLLWDLAPGAEAVYTGLYAVGQDVATRFLGGDYAFVGIGATDTHRTAADAGLNHPPVRRGQSVYAWHVDGGSTTLTTCGSAALLETFGAITAPDTTLTGLKKQVSTQASNQLRNDLSLIEAFAFTTPFDGDSLILADFAAGEYTSGWFVRG